MARRIVIHNEFARATDSKDGLRKVPAHALRVGDKIASGEKVTKVTRTRDGRVELYLNQGGYPRLVHWAADAVVAVQHDSSEKVGAPTPKSFWSYQASTETPSLAEAIELKAISANTTQEKWGQLTPGMKREIVRRPRLERAKGKDGIGTHEEVAYGEGWHSEKNDNPYTDPVHRAAWEKGRTAARQRRSMGRSYFMAEVRGKRFDRPVPNAPVEPGYAARGRDNKPLPARLAQLVTANRDKIQEAFSEVDNGLPSYWVHLRSGWICGAMESGTIHEDTVAGVFQKWKTVHKVDGSRDFKSEKGYVAKIIDVATGNVLSRSEPHISNGVGLKKWIQDEAQQFVRRGKRVKAEVVVAFFDPAMAYDAEFTKRERVRLKTVKPLPSGKTVNLVGLVDFIRPDGLVEVRIITPGLYGGGILKVPPEELERV